MEKLNFSCSNQRDIAKMLTHALLWYPLLAAHDQTQQRMNVSFRRTVAGKQHEDETQKLKQLVAT